MSLSQQNQRNNGRRQPSASGKQGKNGSKNDHGISQNETITSSGGID